MTSSKTPWIRKWIELTKHFKATLFVLSFFTFSIASQLQASRLHGRFPDRVLLEASEVVEDRFAKWTNRYHVRDPRVTIHHSKKDLSTEDEPELILSDFEVYLHYTNEHDKKIYEKLLIIDGNRLLDDTHPHRQVLVDSIIEKALFSYMGLVPYLVERPHLRSSQFVIPRIHPYLDQIDLVLESPSFEGRHSFMNSVTIDFFKALVNAMPKSLSVSGRERPSIIVTDLTWLKPEDVKRRAKVRNVDLREVAQLRLQFGGASGFSTTETLWFVEGDLPDEPEELRKILLRKLRYIVNHMASVNPSKRKALGFEKLHSCANQFDRK